MDNSQEEQAIISQLNEDIKRLQTELNQEKAQREEVETQYFILSNQYNRVIIYIEKNQLRVPSQDGGCFFFTMLTIILFISIIILFCSA
jgi:hypothetical protein